jgi:hypothetical protein
VKHPLDAVVARERGRARLRAVTVTAGAAGLAAAGVFAVNLPAGSHSRAGGGTSASPPTSSPTGTRSGDDGGEGQGAVSSGTAPGSSAGSQAHATSGGS